MTNSLNKLQGLEFINKYLKNLGINKTVTSGDVHSIFDDLEKNEDGTVDTSIFALAVTNEYSDVKMTSIEDDLVEAWFAISGLDGNNDSVSLIDLSGLEAADTPTEETAVQDTGGSSGASGGSSGGGTVSPANANSNKESDAESVKITGKETAAELEASRRDELAQLSEAQAQKENNEEIKAAKEASEEAKAAYDDAMAAFKENEAALYEQIEDLNNQKEENDAAIEEKRAESEDIKNNISEKETAISEAQSELNSLKEPNKDDYAEYDDEGNITGYPGYDEAVAEYEAQKQALEEQIASLEDEISDLQLELAECEESLADLDARANEIDQQIYDAMQSQEMQNNEYAKAAEEALAVYMESKDNLAAVEQQQIGELNAEIAQIRENIAAYSDAIKTAREKEASGEGVEKNKSDMTLEEFLDSIEDPQTKDFYERLYKLYDFDDFNNRTDIPQYFQTVYTDAFSTGTIRSAGCGITSLAMVASYLFGEEITPDMLTNGYKGDNPASAMHAGIKNLGLNLTTYEGWGNATQDMNGDGTNNLDAALDAGKPVIARMGPESLFTKGGHFIVIAGKTEDGKYIVNDPNLENYYNQSMVDGFTNGFTRSEITNGLRGIYVLDTN